MKSLLAQDKLEQCDEILDPTRDPVITELAVRKLGSGRPNAS